MSNSLDLFFNDRFVGSLTIDNDNFADELMQRITSNTQRLSAYAKDIPELAKMDS